MEKYLKPDDIKYQMANLKQLTFEVTDACNLKCKYCTYGEFYNDYEPRQGKKLSVDTAKKVIDYLADLWNSQYSMADNKHVYISFYGGEPLLNMPFIKSIVKYIESSAITRRQFTFSMTTNGTLLEHHMDFLVEKDFHLLISLDGNEYNSSYRVDKLGANSYSEVIRNIEMLRQKYPRFFEERVNFNSVLHNRNSIADIYHFFKEKYNKIPSIGELNNMGIRPDKVDLFWKTYRNSQESLHQAENYELIEKDMFLHTATYRTLTTFIYNHSGFVYQDYTYLLFDQPKKSLPTGTCVPFSRRMFITVNGKILPCERIGQHFFLGTVSDSGVHIDPEAIAQRYNNYFAKLESQCSNCYNRSGCIQCIFNLRDINGSPKCNGFMGRERFLTYKNNQMDFLRNHPEDYYRIMENVIFE